MSRETRNAKLRLKLQSTEADFRELLISSLRRCTDGGAGIFLTEERAARLGDVYPKLVWPETRKLASLGRQIQSLREQVGEPVETSLYAKYRQYRTKDGPNDPGGVRLAAQFLAEIEQGAGANNTSEIKRNERGWTREEL